MENWAYVGHVELKFILDWPKEIKKRRFSDGVAECYVVCRQRPD